MPHHALRPRSRGVLAAIIGTALMAGACTTNSGTGTTASMAGASGSCAETPVGGAYDRTVDLAAPDGALASEALRLEINAERCRRGLVPLGASAAAAMAAGEHARTMARLGFTGHDSPVKGQETFPRRLVAANARFRLAGENVARTPLFATGSQSYAVVDRQKCVFTRGVGGVPIPQQSYRTLADRLVQMWMDSPPHRENMLKPEFRNVGAGIAVAPGDSGCGDVSAAAVFLG